MFLQSHQIGAIHINKDCNNRTKLVFSECLDVEDLVDRYLELDGMYVESPGEKLSAVINGSFEIADSC